ncbi:MAG: ATP-dependent DNA ligase [Planctomycetes bacterium]|nr:ATP-dependent DNA ligase [Planctomycetota bacterium]
MRFAALLAALDGARSTVRRVEAIAAYLRAAPPADAAWGLSLLAGRRAPRLVAPRALGEWALAVTTAPAWQLEAAVRATGDVAEAVALLVDTSRDRDVAGGDSLAACAARLEALAGHDADARRETVTRWWGELREDELVLLCKLLTGTLRPGLSPALVEQAAARFTGLDQVTCARRLAGPWEPTPDLLDRLRAPVDADDPARPFPFALAPPLAGPVEALGPPAGWAVEPARDGVRAQLVRRGGRTWLWTRGDELVTDHLPEVRAAAAALPDCVLEGELVALRGERPLPFEQLRRRLGRARPTSALVAEAPVALVAFDLLEADGADLRPAPLEARRARLEALFVALPADTRARLRPSPLVPAATWAEVALARDEARTRGAQGLLLRRRSASWPGEAWVWGVDPHALDAVLVSAEQEEGRLHTALTFAVWDEGPPPELVTVASARADLAEDELRRLDRWVRRHTVERFGPVRVVEPALVFELRCDGVAPAPRRRAGLILRAPRVARWRADRRPEDAATLARLAALLPPDRPDRRAGDVAGGQMTLF